jgi:hypothetical protein
MMPADGDGAKYVKPPFFIECTNEETGKPMYEKD